MFIVSNIVEKNGNMSRNCADIEWLHKEVTNSRNNEVAARLSSETYFAMKLRKTWSLLRTLPLFETTKKIVLNKLEFYSQEQSVRKVCVNQARVQ